MPEKPSISPENFNQLSEEELWQKKQELLRRDLIEIYDNKNIERKKKYSEEEYVEIREEWLEEAMDAAIAEEKDECRKDEVRESEEKLKEARIDFVTGLKNREGLYLLLEEKVKNLFDIKKSESLSEEEWIELFKSTKTENFPDNHYLAIGDMSFLSFANETGGHDMGDDLLRKTADAIKDKKLNSFRHGGDEFSFAFFDTDELTAKENLLELKKELNKNKDFPGLKDHGLTLNIDVGVASSKEALEVFKEVLKEEAVLEFWENDNAERKGKREKPRKIFERFEDIWVSIADKKAFIEKGKERIPLLMDIYKKDKSKKKETYQKLSKFLGKGGYNIELKDLTRLGELEADEQSKAIEEYILEEEKKSIERLSGYEKIRAQAIAKKIGILQ